MAILLENELFKVTPTAVELRVSDYETAQAYVRQHSQMLARWALEFDRPCTLVHYGRTKPIKVPVCLALEPNMLDQVILPGVRISTTRLSLPLIRELSHFLEHPEEKWALVKLSHDLKVQTQIAMSEACQSLIVGTTVEEAINRQRTEYWHLPDIERLNQATIQQLEPNNPNSQIEFSWFGTDPATRSHWRRFHHIYRLTQDDQGVLYQVCKNVAVEPVAAPAAR